MSHPLRHSRGNISARRSASARRSISGPSGDPFTDASYLESGTSTSDNYASSEDDATPVPLQRTTVIGDASQLAIPYPSALAVTGESSRRPSITAQTYSPPSQRRVARRSISDRPHLSNLVHHIDGPTLTSTSPSPAHDPNETFRFPPRRSSLAPSRQSSVSDHPPPPVSLQNPRRRSSAVGRRHNRRVHRAPSHGATLTGDSQSSNGGDGDVFSEASSDHSDTASIASGPVEYGEGVFGNPFANHAQQRATGDGIWPRPQSSQHNPFMSPSGGILRRGSDDIGPLSPSKSATRYSPVKVQRGHDRNFSRPFSSCSESGSGTLADEKEDRITALEVNPAANRHITFEPQLEPPSSGQHIVRAITHTVPSQAQTDAKKSANGEQAQKVYDEKGNERPRASCVLVNRRKSKYTVAEEAVVRAVGRERLKWTKWTFVVFFVVLNGACIAISWLFQEYWYVFAPVILLGNVLNTLMVLNLTRVFLWRKLVKITGFKKPPILPTEPTVIAMVLACYSESHEELMATLESLHDQTGIDHHKRMFIIVVDGQVRGKGMAKSTDRVLVEDILKPDEEHFYPTGYESWDGAINGIYASAGEWRGVPYVCLVKKRNLGKRDGLILVRTLLYKYQFRFDNPTTSMGDDFFRWFCEFSEQYEIEKFEWLVGVDADTTFNRECIYEMHYKVIQDPKLVGCSGLIQVGFRTGQWNVWNLYQNTEYIRAQCLRRMHQSLGTGKVSCLPGACQIIKICEETCSDLILIDTFGHIPDPKDHMLHQVRALAGEDRNYICIIFEHFPKATTTMAMKAIAFTDPPNGVMVFLSQRKRWTLSTSANDMLISSKNAMNWFERICSFADVMVWVLPIFVAQTLALFIKACYYATDPTFILAFASVTIVPLTYGIVVTYWGCKGWRERTQYLLGFGMVVLLGQMITPVVILYAIWHMDNFSWGKTREVEDDGEGSKPAHSD